MPESAPSQASPSPYFSRGYDRPAFCVGTEGLSHRPAVGFTVRYAINRLVYYEQFGEVRAAISREKQIQGWLRVKKVALIESVNRDGKDLSAGWYGKQAG